jgi:hypothetical protein
MRYGLVKSACLASPSTDLHEQLRIAHTLALLADGLLGSW